MAKGYKTGGRKKGTPNKATVEVKTALQQAFEHRGGIAALVSWADENPTEFYKLWAKLLPNEIKAELGGPDGGAIAHDVRVEFVRAQRTDS